MEKIKTYITEKKQFKYKGKTYNAKITQKWIPILKGGHYIIIVEDKKGNIVFSTSSCCGVPQGLAKDFLKEQIKSIKQMDKLDY